MSNKFTGITSAGSAIPVYDKDAHQALSAKLDASALEPAISGKADTSAIPSLDGYATEQWVGEQGYLTEVPAGYATTEDVISATSGLQPSGDYASASDLANYQPVSSMTAFQAAGDYLSGNALDNLSGTWETVTAKADTTALEAYQTIEGMSAYQAAGNYYSASNPSGFISTVPDTYLQNTDLTIVDNKITEISGVPLSAGDELPSGVMNTSALEYNAVNEISGYNGSAIAQYGAEKQWLQHDDTLVHAANSAQYALGVAIDNVARLMGVDETVLWSGTKNTTAGDESLFDNMWNYNKVDFYLTFDNTTTPQRAQCITRYYVGNHTTAQPLYVYLTASNIAANTLTAEVMYFSGNPNGNSFGLLGGIRRVNSTVTTGITSYNANLVKIVGVGRKVNT